MARTSIGLWAFIWGAYKDSPVPHDQVVETVAGLGFDGVEVAAFEPYFMGNTSRNRRALRRLYDDNGLDRSGLVAPLPSVVTSSPDEYIDAVKGALDICVDVGIPLLRVESGQAPDQLPGNMDTGDAIARAAENWHAAAEECARAEVSLNWEFEPGYVFNKPSQILALSDRVNHPNFRLLFDLSHAHMCAGVGSRHEGEPEVLNGGVEEFISSCAGRIGHIHLDDSDGTLWDGETSSHVPIGRGGLDFDSLIPELTNVGWDDDWWVLDLCFWPNALDVTAESKQSLDGFIQKYGR